MRSRKTIAVLVMGTVAGVLPAQWSSAAQAIPAAAGHDANGSTDTYWTVYNNHVIHATTASPRYWNVPITTSSSSTWASATQQAAFHGTGDGTCIASETSAGALYQYTTYTTSSTVGSVDIPFNGTAFIQSKSSWGTGETHDEFRNYFVSEGT